MSAKSEFGHEQLQMLGRRLRMLREARKHSLRGLAGESGVSVATIRELEAGNSSPSLLNVLSLAEVLGESVDRLIAASMEPSRPLHIVRGSLPPASAKHSAHMAVLTQPRMRGTILIIPPKGNLSEVDRPTEGPIFAYVIDGTIELTFASGRKERLSAGDAIHVAKEPLANAQESLTTWSNPLAKRAVVLSAVALSAAADG